MKCVTICILNYLIVSIKYNTRCIVIAVYRQLSIILVVFIRMSAVCLQKAVMVTLATKIMFANMNKSESHSFPVCHC